MLRRVAHVTWMSKLSRGRTKPRDLIPRFNPFSANHGYYRFPSFLSLQSRVIVWQCDNLTLAMLGPSVYVRI